jgi:serine/threonine protein phosphatase 1
MTTLFETPRFAVSTRLPLTGADGVALSFPSDTIAFAIGDVHGHATGLVAALEGTRRLTAPGKRRVLVLTGDLIDRGPNSLEVLAIAARAGADYGFDDVHWTPGNHDLLMLDGLESMAMGGDGGRAGEIWMGNGGIATLESFLGDAWARVAQNPTAMVEAIDQRLPMWNGQPLRAALRAQPSHVRIGDVVFVHAGLDRFSGLPFEDGLALPQQAHLSKDRPSLSAPSDHDRHWAWIRHGFLHQPGSVDANGRPVLVVHGHTIAKGADIGWLHAPDTDLVAGLDARTAHGRVCIDGGAARAALVAGCAITSDGIRLFAAPAAP